MGESSRVLVASARTGRRALAAFRCQIEVSISSSSAVVTSETGILPMRGEALRLRLDIHSRW